MIEWFHSNLYDYNMKVWYSWDLRISGSALLTRLPLNSSSPLLSLIRWLKSLPESSTEAVRGVRSATTFGYLSSRESSERGSESYSPLGTVEEPVALVSLARNYRKSSKLSTEPTGLWSPDVGVPLHMRPRSKSSGSTTQTKNFIPRR